MKDIELFNDSFQNYKVYGIPKAQLILTDVPYVLGKNAYASNPSWYVGGGIIRTEKVSWQASNSFLLIVSFALLSLCISVQKCLSKNRKNLANHLV